MSVVVLILVMALNNKAVINEGKTALKACLAYDLDRKSINCTYLLVFPICPFRFCHPLKLFAYHFQIIGLETVKGDEIENIPVHILLCLTHKLVIVRCHAFEYSPIAVQLF